MTARTNESHTWMYVAREHVPFVRNRRPMRKDEWRLDKRSVNTGNSEIRLRIAGVLIVVSTHENQLDAISLRAPFV